jgi:endogenous inhibitor of DNA gyrase (YacG/DUF329 family)
VEMKFICFTCKKEIRSYKSNEHFPYCSERCYLLELYKWQNGEYAIDDSEELMVIDDREEPERFWANEEDE